MTVHRLGEDLMRARTRCVGFVAAIVGLVACGSSGTVSKTRPPTSTPTTLSTAQLQAMLLTAGDVGGGWKAGEPINPQDLAAVSQLPCEKTISPAIAKRLTAVAGTQFEPVDRSYKHLIELVTTGNPTQLASDLQSLFGAIESCSTATSTGTGGAKLTVRTLTIPTLGDQHAAYAVTQAKSASSATALYLRSAYVRLGSVAVILGLADFQATAQGKSHVSDDAFIRLLQTAIAKLKG